MSQYNFNAVEKKWQKKWQTDATFAKEDTSTKPKFYALDMFPYPSGAGLHVGHPLGYIATDIVVKYKKMKGYNVIHPMGFDAFGLPAENYAIQHGIPPAITTEKNIKRYKEQMQLLGLTYDPDSELRTCDPHYYRWTQWIFLQLFNSWYNTDTDKAEPLTELIDVFKNKGNVNVHAATNQLDTFSADEWQNYSEKEQSDILLNYRLAYLSFAQVNWCPALGTVLANEEVKDGVSERGGHPVERKSMRQWSLRITAYAERLLRGLDNLNWSSSLLDMQRHWIGKSSGASIHFPLEQAGGYIEVFTTRPDTIYGVSFMVLAPEHELIERITTKEQRQEVSAYVELAAARSERDRMSDVKTVSGAFTGAYAINPVSGDKVPIWIADYVLASYGTGAVMAVPAGDSRDFAFAKHFSLDIPLIFQDQATDTGEAKMSYESVLTNSGILDGIKVPNALPKIINYLENKGLGKEQVTYRLRDAIFSRQRYWGEPFPILFKDDIPYAVDEADLPVTLPDVKSYKPTGTGESPLAAVAGWVNAGDGYTRETDTMPGWAGSSWYFLRYTDAANTDEFVNKESANYWLPVDLYVGGAEHAVGHLLYSRFWTKFLYDRGYLGFDEPFKKLVNQGMIQGRSSIAYKDKEANTFVSKGLMEESISYIAIHVDVSLVKDDVLDTESFRKWMPEYREAEFILENGKFVCGVEIEKMSKSLHNVVNPDELCKEFGTDTFRMYEMFLGPLEAHKPWNTNGISGVFNLIKKVYKVCIDDAGQLRLTDEQPTSDELKILHKTIKKVSEDIDSLSFNTSVSQFMIFINEISKLKSNKRAIIEPFLQIMAAFAPHFCEEIWERLGHTESIFHSRFPEYDEKWLAEDSFEYPVSVNGKLRVKLNISLDMKPYEVEAYVLTHEALQKYIGDKHVKKVIVVPGRIVNIVV